MIQNTAAVYFWIVLVTRSLQVTLANCPALRGFTLFEPGSRSPGMTIGQYGPMTPKLCERTCRQYLDCQGYLITWVDNGRNALGYCNMFNGTVDNTHVPGPNESIYVYCPGTFRRIGGGCYVAENSALSRDDAQTRCTELHPDAHLIEIQTAQKKDVMIRVARDAGLDTIWVSAKRPDHATHFTWMFSGEPMTYADWSFETMDPHMIAGENCVLFTTRFSNQGGWNMIDVVCNRLRPFICEV